METASNTDPLRIPRTKIKANRSRKIKFPSRGRRYCAGDRQVSECDISCETAKNECEKCDAKESEDEIKEKEEKSKRELEIRSQAAER